jgi:3-phenylpropionate/trans-cinnamate dioxygenase ferredoxin subunit
VPQVKVAPLSDLPEHGSRAFPVEGHDILLCRTSAGLFAVANQCSHAQSPLAGGKVKGPYVFCPLHGIRFDLRTGEPNGQLTKSPIAVFPVSVVDGIVEIELP